MDVGRGLPLPVVEEGPGRRRVVDHVRFRRPEPPDVWEFICNCSFSNFVSSNSIAKNLLRYLKRQYKPTAKEQKAMISNVSKKLLHDS